MAEHFFHIMFDLILRHLLDPWPIGNIVEYVHMGKQRIALKNGVYIPLIRLLLLLPMGT